ncbi:hypothetical protein [Pontibacter vulgaris]|uniref:hypothetical protein n=1 Tax=Pontibacter vulgaris TaxID=2905679 RepID=UPI001FA7920E|nr:hypothetical protein [Pontibacter vulgaris]
METQKKAIKKEIINLVNEGKMIFYHEALTNNKLSKTQIQELKELDNYKKFLKNFSSLRNSYQAWYSKALLVVKQVFPDRIDEFTNYYKNEKRKDISYSSYTINDYLLNIVVRRGIEYVFDSFSAFAAKMENQLAILESGIDRIDSILSNIEGILQSELFDNELEASKDLLKKKHIRASGVLAGVTLETHLGKVCTNHNLKFKKAHPTISDFNEELKKECIIDVPTWRLIQRLGDIRNMSAHPKEREPKADEIEDLIRGTEKLIAELY